jgi:hypothetical protein
VSNLVAAHPTSQKKAQPEAALKSTKGGGWRRLGSGAQHGFIIMENFVHRKNYLVRRRIGTNLTDSYQEVMPYRQFSPRLQRISNGMQSKVDRA